MHNKPQNDLPPSQYLRETTNLLYNGSSIGIVLSFLAVTLLTFLVVPEQDNNLKYTLWAMMLVVLAGRSADLVYWITSLKKSDFDPRPAFVRISTGIVATSVMWATYVVALYSSFDLISLSAALIAICAMTSGTQTLLAPSKPLCIAYATILLVPVSLCALFDEQVQYSILGGLGLAFWIATISIALKSNAFIMRAVELKHSNKTLLEKVREERDEITRVNSELRRSNEALDHANASLEVEVTKRTDHIHRLSNRDPLTGLMNRKGFSRLINSQIAASQRMNNSFALLFIDLDGFKQVNDSLGHAIGDGVLEQVAVRLSRYSDPNQLGRWGGDEFVMLLPYATEDTATAVAHATRGSIALPIDVESYQISLDATIGIALFPDHADNAQDLIQLADLTMYEQKKIKPGSYAVFNKSIYNRLQDELTIRDGLRNAIEDNAFSLMYQPIINAQNGTVWGLEALLRWTHNDTPVSPAKFIPLAEKSGLINDIGSWVLHRACIDAAQWSQLDHAVSVNVSVIQLMDDSFAGTLNTVLKSSGLQPERLHLEITESVFADDKARVLEQVNAIKSRGVQISIDDFGTGFSSLSQLQSLDFDHIKIDRAFVQNLEEGSDTIIRATLLIAKEFECVTVAEGIETLEHAQRLTSMGVDCLQGYYFAKPMPNAKLNEWLDNFRFPTLLN